LKIRVVRLKADDLYQSTQRCDLIFFILEADTTFGTTHPSRFTQIIKKETNGRKRMRLLAVSYFLDSLSRTDISTTLSSVNRCVTAYLTKGSSGLDSVRPKGSSLMLSPKQLSQLALYVENYSCATECSRLMGQDFCTFIKEGFDINYHRNHVYKVLKKLGYSWIISRQKQ
jgi:transposase